MAGYSCLEVRSLCTFPDISGTYLDTHNEKKKPTQSAGMASLERRPRPVFHENHEESPYKYEMPKIRTAKRGIANTYEASQHRKVERFYRGMYCIFTIGG